MRAGSCPAVEGPLSIFVRLLNEQIDMANRLELIADGLPHEVDRNSCADLAHRLPVVACVCWQIDRDIILPVLAKRPSGAGLSPSTAARLQDERLTDHGYALEVSELLGELAAAGRMGGRAGESNAAGYLLRGFFEASRRTASFELEFIVPAAQRALSETDLGIMARLLARHVHIVSEACLTTRVAIKNHSLQ